MLKLNFLLFFCCYLQFSQAQQPGKIVKITVLNNASQPMPAASVQLLKHDSTLLQAQGTDRSGVAEFTGLQEDNYIVRVTYTGYEDSFIDISDLQKGVLFNKTLTLKVATAVLQGVTVNTKRPFIQFRPDKTVVNVDAGITNAGATVMDVLEKSPGITIGRDGTIIMKGKPQVMVLIDGKQTQLSGTELQAYLSGISASQVDVIELIDNPGAKYDAAGNAGIINIKTKTSKQKGFNGSLSLSAGQGYYPKSNNSLNLNYRTGKFNLFVNYGTRLGKERMEMYALRKYFDTNGNDSLLLQQPNVTRTNIYSNNIKTGIDFFASKRTTAGIVFTGNLTDRDIHSVSIIDWMTPSYVIDSTINTSGTRSIRFKRAGLNFNVRHTFNASSELFADIDVIRFDINGDQYFQTQLASSNSSAQATKGNIPSELNIFTAKIDYSNRFRDFLWETGKRSRS